MTNDLLPCPFNHKHEIERYITGDGTMVSCCSCGIEMHVDQWNTRTHNKPAEVDLDGLKKPLTSYWTTERDAAVIWNDAIDTVKNHLATENGGGDKVTVEVSKLLDIRNALCRDDFFEAYHHLYTLVEWQDPYNAWAEWEKVAPEKKLTPQPAAPTQIDAEELEAARAALDGCWEICDESNLPYVNPDNCTEFVNRYTRVIRAHLAKSKGGV